PQSAAGSKVQLLVPWVEAQSKKLRLHRNSSNSLFLIRDSASRITACPCECSLRVIKWREVGGPHDSPKNHSSPCHRYIFCFIPSCRTGKLSAHGSATKH